MPYNNKYFFLNSDGQKNFTFIGTWLLDCKLPPASGE